MQSIHCSRDKIFSKISPLELLVKTEKKTSSNDYILFICTGD